MLQRALIALGWEEHEKTGPSVGKAFSAVRTANASEELRADFLQERAVRLKEQGHASFAFDWLGKVLASDGMDGDETEFLERARGLLFD